MSGKRIDSTNTKGRVGKVQPVHPVQKAHQRYQAAFKKRAENPTPGNSSAQGQAASNYMVANMQNMGGTPSGY